MGNIEINGGFGRNDWLWCQYWQGGTAGMREFALKTDTHELRRRMLRREENWTNGVPQRFDSGRASWCIVSVQEACYSFRANWPHLFCLSFESYLFVCASVSAPVTTLWSSSAQPQWETCRSDAWVAYIWSCPEPLSHSASSLWPNSSIVRIRLYSA